ncbi:ribonuclease III [Erysipelothrix larvae]|uniref:Ribonuclease 3 n=1 Tax=Erysipelothrix larvae TaxID=1514105 RepID=A0A0X8GZN7_9FIRM|nr:ribonuclease III [Erysipelothrix larvae]AMC93319.1 ribonuclease III [Erysipelothrix larvae]
MTIWDLLKKLDIPVNNEALIEQAFVHSSCMNEKTDYKEDYERLEFMGDAVLQVSVSNILFNHKNHWSEGEMTLIRARLVCEEALAGYSRKLGLEKYLVLGLGEERNGGRNRDSIVADIFESLSGAIYIDSGLENAQKLIYAVLPDDLEAYNAMSVMDYKTKLQEFVQSDRRDVVTYEVISVTGPQNAPTFEVVVKLNDLVFGKGIGTSKKRAEQMAARDAFEKLVK